MYLILDDLCFDPSGSERGFSVGGELYVSVDDMFFPAEHWYDLSYVCLKNWLPALISFGKNHTDSCSLSFMDGPYRIIFTRIENKIINVSLLRDGLHINHFIDIDFLGFIKSVKACCHRYDRFLHENGKDNLFTKEINELISILDT